MLVQKSKIKWILPLSSLWAVNMPTRLWRSQKLWGHMSHSHVAKHPGKDYLKHRLIFIINLQSWKHIISTNNSRTCMWFLRKVWKAWIKELIRLLWEPGYKWSLWPMNAEAEPGHILCRRSKPKTSILAITGPNDYPNHEKVLKTIIKECPEFKKRHLLCTSCSHTEYFNICLFCITLCLWWILSLPRLWLTPIFLPTM